MGPIAHTRGWSRSAQMGPIYSGAPRPPRLANPTSCTMRPRAKRPGIDGAAIRGVALSQRDALRPLFAAALHAATTPASKGLGAANLLIVA
jgi:hypothetical protein